MGADLEVNQSKTIFFDGVCNLCNGFINFLIDRDKKQKFTFASLQSGYATTVFQHTPVNPAELDGILFKNGERVYRKSDAVLEIARELSGLWPLFYLFRIFPRSLRDLIYDYVAGNRYKWFGKKDVCRIPTPELKARFLDS